jgi:membrane fusion protein, epimerase transport system
MPRARPADGAEPMPELAVLHSSRLSAPPGDGIKGPIAAGLAVALIFFAGFGSWAAYAPLNGAVVAPAVVKVEGSRKTIQHLDGGIVKELKVKEGDHVTAGEIVIALEDTQPRAARDILARQYDLLRAQEARLLAERDGAREVGFPADLLARRDEPEVDKLLSTEKRQFQIRRTSLEGQIDVLNQRIHQSDEQIAGLQAQQAAVRKQIEIITAQLRDEYFLLEKGLTQRPRVLELERASAGLRGQDGDITASIARARQAIGEMQFQIIQAGNDRVTDVAKDLRDTQAKLVDLFPRLQAAQDVLDRTQMRTPYSGVVVDLGVFSVGAVIQRGDKVMDIVPTQNELTVEANVNVDDIHDVHPGMRAEVHFTAYKQRVIPVIHGIVVDVSADRLTDKRTGQPYYTAVVRVDRAELAKSKEIELYPGMAATVMIETKARTALDYLLGPVVASLDQSFRQK